MLKYKIRFTVKLLKYILYLEVIDSTKSTIQMKKNEN